MLNCCHSRQEDARGKGSKLTCGELARIFFSFFFLCRLSDSVGPSGKLLQPRGDGAREREKAEWRRDALRSVSGFMELCTSDPPPWIAIRDHSFTFYLFYCPALSLRSPSSTPPTKVSELSVCGHVCLRVCARVCVWTARGARRGQCWALTADCPIFNDELMWSARRWRWGSQMRRDIVTNRQWLDTKLESRPKQGRRGSLISVNLASAAVHSLNGDEWTERWRDSSQKELIGGRGGERTQLRCLFCQ